MIITRDGHEYANLNLKARLEQFREEKIAGFFVKTSEVGNLPNGEQVLIECSTSTQKQELIGILNLNSPKGPEDR